MQCADYSARFWAKVDKDGPDGCWVWTASISCATATSSGGYGRFWLPVPGGRLATAAHRVAYELEVGPIPKGLVIDHLCRNRACVNPEHLEPVTQRENCQRGAHGRMVTHCPQGHPYDDANTYRDPKGMRHCRACRRGRELERYHRMKGAR